MAKPQPHLHILPALSQDLVQGFKFVGPHLSSIQIHVVVLPSLYASSACSASRAIILWHHDTPSHEQEATSDTIARTDGEQRADLWRSALAFRAVLSFCLSKWCSRQLSWSPSMPSSRRPHLGRRSRNQARSSTSRPKPCPFDLSRTLPGDKTRCQQEHGNYLLTALVLGAS